LGLRAWGVEGWLRSQPASSRTPAWRCKMAIRSYRDLEVWRLSMDLLSEVYQLSGRLPRTSDSHSENRCEGHPFRSPRILRKASGGAPVGEYARFGGISNGSLKELETHIEADRWLAYFSDAEVSRAIE